MEIPQCRKSGNPLDPPQWGYRQRTMNPSPEKPMPNQPAALLNTIDADKATLDAARPLPPHTMASLREKLMLEWTYHSNAIEGNTLTLRENQGGTRRHYGRRKVSSRTLRGDEPSRRDPLRRRHRVESGSAVRMADPQYSQPGVEGHRHQRGRPVSPRERRDRGRGHDPARLPASACRHGPR